MRPFRNHKPTVCLLLSSILIVFSVACSIGGTGDFASLVTEFDAEIPTAVRSGNAPSIQVAVVREDQVVWSQAFGENTSVDHVYMNGSVQKMFTSVAILQLVDRGVIDLDTDVSTIVPFPLRHPDYPETPITIRMLLAHRSGMDAVPHQFGWDTESAFSPQYRPACPSHLATMSHEEFLISSLTPGGSNYARRAWIHTPGQRYHYSVTAYPLLRYVISRVTKKSYADYMHENIFAPLGMTSSEFSAGEFPERHAIPYTRINGQNIKLPIWDGHGSMIHATAEDMAKFVIALMNNGRYGHFQLLRPETIELMRKGMSRFKVLFKSSDDMHQRGHGLGVFLYRGGWYGYGGSVPGFQCLLRFHPSRKVGYVILANVNAILSGGDNYISARRDIYEVQDALVSILDPMLVIRRRNSEIGIIGAFVLYLLMVRLFVGWWKSRHRNDKVTPKT